VGSVKLSVNVTLVPKDGSASPVAVIQLDEMGELRAVAQLGSTDARTLGFPVLFGVLVELARSIAFAQPEHSTINARKLNFIISPKLNVIVHFEINIGGLRLRCTVCTVWVAPVPVPA
jgi:hypothetical protein